MTERSASPKKKGSLKREVMVDNNRTITVMSPRVTRSPSSPNHKRQKRGVGTNTFGYEGHDNGLETTPLLEMKRAKSFDIKIEVNMRPWRIQKPKHTPKKSGLIEYNEEKLEYKLITSPGKKKNRSYVELSHLKVSSKEQHFLLNHSAIAKANAKTRKFFPKYELSNFKKLELENYESKSKSKDTNENKGENEKDATSKTIVNLKTVKEPSYTNKRTQEKVEKERSNKKNEKSDKKSSKPNKKLVKATDQPRKNDENLMTPKKKRSEVLPSPPESPLKGILYKKSSNNYSSPKKFTDEPEEKKTPRERSASSPSPIKKDEEEDKTPRRTLKRKSKLESPSHDSKNRSKVKKDPVDSTNDSKKGTTKPSNDSPRKSSEKPLPPSQQDSTKKGSKRQLAGSPKESTAKPLANSPSKSSAKPADSPRKSNVKILPDSPSKPNAKPLPDSPTKRPNRKTPAKEMSNSFQLNKSPKKSVKESNDPSTKPPILYSKKIISNKVLQQVKKDQNKGKKETSVIKSTSSPRKFKKVSINEEASFDAPLSISKTHVQNHQIYVEGSNQSKQHLQSSYFESLENESQSLQLNETKKGDNVFSKYSEFEVADSKDVKPKTLILPKRSITNIDLSSNLHKSDTKKNLTSKDLLLLDEDLLRLKLSLFDFTEPEIKRSNPSQSDVIVIDKQVCRIEHPINYTYVDNCFIIGNIKNLVTIKGKSKHNFSASKNKNLANIIDGRRKIKSTKEFDSLGYVIDKAITQNFVLDAIEEEPTSKKKKNSRHLRTMSASDNCMFQLSDVKLRQLKEETRLSSKDLEPQIKLKQGLAIQNSFTSSGNAGKSITAKTRTRSKSRDYSELVKSTSGLTQTTDCGIEVSKIKSRKDFKI